MNPLRFLLDWRARKVCWNSVACAINASCATLSLMTAFTTTHPAGMIGIGLVYAILAKWFHARIPVEEEE